MLSPNFPKNPLVAYSISSTAVSFKSSISATSFLAGDNISYQCSGFK